MKYRVIAASCHGKNGKVWNFGDEVEESEFIGNRFEEQRPEQLVAEGFLVRVEGEKKEQKPEAKKVQKKRGPKKIVKREKKIKTASESLELAGSEV